MDDTHNWQFQFILSIEKVGIGDRGATNNILFPISNNLFIFQKEVVSTVFLLGIFD